MNNHMISVPFVSKIITFLFQVALATNDEDND